jgi:CHAT domain-containing protein/tetratricopeptide (TPR) repeat protein
MTRHISIAFVWICLFTQAGLCREEIAFTLDFGPLETLLEESDYEGLLSNGKAILEDCRTRWPEGSLDEAKTLDFLIQAAYRSRQVMNPEALAWADRAIEIKNDLLGANHPELANSLMHAGNLRNLRYEYDLAIPLYRRAETILHAAGDPEKEHLGTILSSLSVAYRRSGELDPAFQVAREAEAVLEELHGPEHLSLASPLNNQAVILSQLGDYTGSARIHRRALAIRENNLGPDHEWVAESANNLGNQLAYLGLFEESLELQERAARIFQKRLGEEHPRTLWTRMNLAITYMDMGDAEDASGILEEVLAGTLAVFGPENPQVWSSTETLAACRYDQGLFQEALDLYQQALGWREKSYGPDSYDCWDTHAQIGKCQIALGHLDQAVVSLERSLAILAQNLDEENVLLCESLHRLAHLHITRGDFQQAADLAAQSRDLCLRDLDKNHPLLAEAMSLYGQSMRGLGRGGEAMKAALEAEQISRNHLTATMPVLSEHRALHYAGSRIDGVGLALSLLDDGERGERVARVWDSLIRSRGQVLDHFADRNRSLGGHAGPRVAALRDSSLALREMLANLTLRGPGWEEVDVYQGLIRDLRRELTAAERELSVLRNDQTDREASAQAGLTQIRQSLPAGAALLAFARQQYPDDSPEYLAFVLADEQADPIVFRLGAAATIDRAVAGWRSQVSVGLSEVAGSEKQRLAINRGFVKVARDPGKRIEKYREIGNEVRGLIWDPLADALAGAEQVFIVADGSLHLLSFPSLPLGSGRFLVEEPAVLHLLTTEKNLLSSSNSPDESGRILALGGVLYGENEDSVPEQGVRHMEFTPLPEAGHEARMVADFWREAGWQAEVLTGAMATEKAVKDALAGTRVLHLATHGFFLPEATGTEKDHSWDNPLSRSGLALAGANTWHQSTGAEDGILTAQEVAAMDLGSVQWAVLSACDTGLGQVAGRGEGVFGLRRAFALAGAHTVIMSLWAVQDEQTRHWMDHLYRARWQEGLSTAEAVREASLTELANRRDLGLSDHPYYWAGFLAAGDWR